jgi:hypothetical protein
MLRSIIAVLPDPRDRCEIVGIVCVLGRADHLTLVVDSVGEADRETGQRTETYHHAVLPEKGVVDYVLVIFWLCLAGPRGIASFS